MAGDPFSREKRAWGGRGPVACTIVARNAMAQARVTASSFHEHHQRIPFAVLLADGAAEDELDGRGELQLAGIGEIELPERRRFLFLHGREPLTYALTPFWLAHLLGRGFDQVLFLKQESLVVGDLEPLFARLREAPLLLTPHLGAPLAGHDGADRELQILLAGAYNGGVLGVAAGSTAHRFLAWWSERVAAGCRHEVEAGWHYEQRWLDLVPAYFPGVAIERDPGANCGHWCLPERRIEPSGGGWLVDGGPLRVMRFSGYDPANPQWATRYFRRLAVADLGPAAKLFEDFRRRLRDAGDSSESDAPFGFASFDNGVAIPDVAREILREQGPACSRWEDPFRTAGGESFYAFLNEPAPGSEAGFPTRLWQAIHRRRPDLQGAFPSPQGRDREAFRDWAASSGLAEHGIAPAFFPPLEKPR